VLYYVMAGAIATTATVQITQQLFFPDDPAQSEPPQSCETGLAVLHEAVIRARAQVERDTTAVGALPRYRAEVARGWQHHAAVRTLCADNPVHSSTLDSLERLRYAEGRGVRSYGAELAALRRHVADRIVREQTEQ